MYRGGSLMQFQQINAEEILKKIELGQDVSYKDRIIIGDLDADKIKLPKINIGYSEWIYNKPRRKINQCIKLGDDANFITSKICLKDCIICGSMNFSKTIFYESINFEGSIFEEKLSFSCSKFNNSVLMWGAIFNKSVDFNRAIFRQEANFKQCEFKGIPTFLQTIFYKKICFEEAKFNNASEFRGSEFRDRSFFWHCRFNKNARFDRAQFCKDANFTGINCERSIYLIDTDFKCDLTFDYARFNETVYFEKFNVHGNLKLEKSRIHSLNIGPDSNISHIFMKDAVFTRLIVPWDFLNSRIDYDKSLYLALIKNYKELGWFDDEDQCYFMHREESRSKKPCRSSQFLDYVSLHSCGYGIEPKYALLASFKIILGFSVLFFAKFTFWKSLLGDALITKPELPNSTITVLSNNDSFLVTNNFINQMDYLLLLDYVIKFFNAIYFSAIIFLSQIPNDLYISGIWRFVVVFERILGWMLMALFIVVLTKKLIR